MPRPTLAHAAQMFQKMAFHTIPTRPQDKALALRRGQRKTYERRCPTEQEVRAWWTREPGYNVALLLGPDCRLLILNVNQKHGHDGLGTLKRKGLVIREDLTPTILTPHDGMAYCFKPPDREQFSYPFRTHVVVPDYPGIELRGAGGYQLVPPSSVKATTRDPGGDYRFAMPWTAAHLFSECPEMPDWLLELWLACDRHQHPAQPRSRTKPTAPQPTRRTRPSRSRTAPTAAATTRNARSTTPPQGAYKKQELLKTGARAGTTVLLTRA